MFFNIVFLSLLLPSIVIGSVPFYLNPGCSLIECEQIGLPAIFYGTQTIGNRTIHLLFSSLDQLTLSIFDTKLNVAPSFNYSALFARNYSNAIQFNDAKPFNSFSIVLRRVIQFNDVKDTGRINVSDPTIITYDLKDSLTTNRTSVNKTNENPIFELPLPVINGSFSVDILFPGQKVRDSKFPKLQVSNEGFYLNIAFQADGYNQSKTRFGLEFYLMSFDQAGFKSYSSRYIDDQYTPGIFNVWQLRTIDVLYKSSMLWKPVVYLDDSRSIEQNTLMQIYSLKNNLPLLDSDQGIYRSLYKPAASYVTGMNVSWGQANDGFFTKSNYTFVQFTAALNELEMDSTTSFVTYALIGSFALPALVGLLAMFLVLRQRFRSSSPTMSNYSVLS